VTGAYELTPYHEILGALLLTNRTGFYRYKVLAEKKPREFTLSA